MPESRPEWRVASRPARLARDQADWSLVTELGIEYPSSSTESAEPLVFPVHAEQADDGTYIIVDCMARSRSLRVDAQGATIFDSRARGIDDAYACAGGDGTMVLLSRTDRRLLVIPAHGHGQRTIDLSALSARKPQLVSWTCTATFLVACFDGVDGGTELLEIDSSGRVLWRLVPDAAGVAVPASVQLLPAGTILLADERLSVVTELSRDGIVRRRVGSAPVANPLSATSSNGGVVLIADTRNHRVLSVDPEGITREVTLADDAFSSPASAVYLRNGHCLVSDAGNHRVVELDCDGRMVWHYGRRAAPRRLLSFPRSVEAGRDGRVLVSDTYHDRVVEFGPSGEVTKVWGDGAGFFWPRCARITAGGSLLVADSRHGRIVELTRDGAVVRELWSLQMTGHQSLGDPHDVWPLANDHLLITDAALGLVVEVDWNGCVYWALGDGGTLELEDPHSAQLARDNWVLIADTGNNRVVVADRRRGVRRSWSEFQTSSGASSLDRPRYAHESRGGHIAIVDTGNDRVLGVNDAGHLLWELKSVTGSPFPTFQQPRWAQWATDAELLVSDCHQHRILRFERPTGLES